MAASETFTWEIAVADGGARRPSIEDLGGVDLIDDPSYPPPRDGTHLYSDMVIQLIKQVHALAKMVPLAKLTIGFASGDPYIITLDTPNDNLMASDFTLTDNGTGDVTIEWDEGLLPPVSTAPLTSVTTSTTNDVSISAYPPTATSVRVRVKVGGVASDSPFTVAI